MDKGESFQSGVYVHYKGGIYTGISILRHHDHREPMVEYVSHTTGNRQVREYRQSDHWGHAVDAWTDTVEWPLGSGTMVPRFQYVKALA